VCADESKAAGEGQGEAKKPKLGDKATANRIRKLKKKLRDLESANASEELKLALQLQIDALTPYLSCLPYSVLVSRVAWMLTPARRSAEEAAEAAIHRRLAQIEKLEQMQRDVRLYLHNAESLLCADATRHTTHDTTHTGSAADRGGA
jgi:hypothetical protein